MKQADSGVWSRSAFICCVNQQIRVQGWCDGVDVSPQHISVCITSVKIVSYLCQTPLSALVVTLLPRAGKWHQVMSSPIKLINF